MAFTSSARVVSAGFLRAAAALALIGAPACGGSVDVGAAGSATGSASTTGAGSSTSGTGGVSTTGSATTGSTSASTTGAGGASCAGSIEMHVDGGSTQTFDMNCGSWATEVPTAIGYVFQGGPPPGVYELVIGGCNSSAPGAEGLELRLPDAKAAGDYTIGDARWWDPNGQEWGVEGDPFEVSIATLDPPGGVVAGSFDVIVSHGGNAAFTLKGTFSVCRVADQLTP